MKFWAAWPNSPRKVGKAACLKKWRSNGIEWVAEKILAHVETMKRTDQWKRGFEPAPLTYLNQRRWEDGEPGETPAGEKPWFLTSTGIEGKAAEFGLKYDDVEPWPDFRDRVFAKAGLTRVMFEDARRQWQA